MRSLAGNAEGAAGEAEVFAAASEVMAEAFENDQQARLSLHPFGILLVHGVAYVLLMRAACL